MRNFSAEKPEAPIAECYAVGAYGRVANQSDWYNGLDFRLADNGPYFSIRDTGQLMEAGYTRIVFMPAKQSDWMRDGPLFTIELYLPAAVHDGEYYDPHKYDTKHL